MASHRTKPYFAYGSNMWLEQMARRCPASRVLGPGRLADHRWTISARGYANVVSSPGDHVLGTVFALTVEDEDALDRHEGVHLDPPSYLKRTLPVSLEPGREACLVYVDPRLEEGEAWPEYRVRIRNGLRDAALPAAYVERYLARFLGAP